MVSLRPDELEEAASLLREVTSWSDDEIEELPKLYREKAREYRRLLQPGQE